MTKMKVHNRDDDENIVTAAHTYPVFIYAVAVVHFDGLMLC